MQFFLSFYTLSRYYSSLHQINCVQKYFKSTIIIVGLRSIVYDLRYYIAHPEWQLFSMPYYLKLFTMFYFNLSNKTLSIYDNENKKKKKIVADVIRKSARDRYCGNKTQ